MEKRALDLIPRKRFFESNAETRLLELLNDWDDSLENQEPHVDKLLDFAVEHADEEDGKLFQQRRFKSRLLEQKIVQREADEDNQSYEFSIALQRSVPLSDALFFAGEMLRCWVESDYDLNEEDGPKLTSELEMMLYSLIHSASEIHMACYICCYGPLKKLTCDLLMATSQGKRVQFQHYYFNQVDMAIFDVLFASWLEAHGAELTPEQRAVLRDHVPDYS